MIESILLTQHSMLHNLFTIEVSLKTSGGVEYFCFQLYFVKHLLYGKMFNKSLNEKIILLEGVFKRYFVIIIIRMLLSDKNLKSKQFLF